MKPCEILANRGVTRLCHFTKLNNLVQIITSEDGILSSDSIRPDIKDVTDSIRYDGVLDHVCCSVEFPNSWFLNSAKQNNRDKIFREWAVIYIKPEILDVRQAKYCPCNASKNRGGFISDNMEELESIFADEVSGFEHRRRPSMLSCCPTNGQAEILIKDNIPRDFFSGIAVGNEDVANRVYAMFKTFDLKGWPIYISSDVLTTRWSEMARNGKRPREIKFQGAEV